MAWTRYALVFLCCAPLPAMAADPWCSVRGKPALTFAWQPANQAEPSVGRVLVRDAAGKTVQVLDKLENYGGSSDSLRTEADFNNDGCRDLVVTNSVAGIGNETISVFLYQPGKRRFVLNEALSEIGGLELASDDRNCVTGSWKGGAMDMYTSRQCWVKGRLVMKSEYQVSARYKEDGEVQCYEHVETAYRGGRKHTKTSCTQEF